MSTRDDDDDDDDEGDVEGARALRLAKRKRRMGLLKRGLVAAGLLALLLLFIYASVDFVPPLYHAVSYDWLTRSLDQTTFSDAGLYWIGLFHTFHYVPATVQVTWPPGGLLITS